MLSRSFQKARHLRGCACSLQQRTITWSRCLRAKENIMNVFDREAKRLQLERAAQAADVSSFDYLKEEMGYRLADRVVDINRRLEVCVDIGSGRGYVTRHLTKHSVDKLYALELSPTMLGQCQMPPEEEGIFGEKIRFDVDSERLPFEDESVDLVTSSLSMHWVNNLPRLFGEVKRILKKDGVFIGSMFGGETLFELRCSLQMAELEREGGFGSHISPFVQVQDLGNLLHRTGFTMLTIDTDEMKVRFQSIFSIMKDLKGMAENNAAWTRKPHLHRDSVLACDAIYRHLYGEERQSEEGDETVVHLPATFQVFFWIGWKPSPSQPKPLTPQKSDVSLKDIYKLEEVVKNIPQPRKDDDSK